MMVSHFIDVVCKGDGDMPSPLALAAAAQSLHRSGYAGQFALALPAMDGPDPGNTLRIFSASADVAAALRQHLVEGGMTWHATVTHPEEIPQDVSSWAAYCSFKIDPRSKIARRSKRYEAGKTKAEAYSDEEIEAALRKNDQKTKDHPFLHLQSLSNGNTFQLFVRRITRDAPGEPGSVNAFGFSSGAFASGGAEATRKHWLVLPHF